MAKHAYDDKPVTEQERFRSLSPNAKAAYLRLRRVMNRYAVVGREAVQREQKKCMSAVDELVSRAMLVCDKHGTWLVPRPEYADELARGFGLAAEETREMLVKLAGNRS